MLCDLSKVTLPDAFAWRGFGSHPYLRLQQGTCQAFHQIFQKERGKEMQQGSFPFILLRKLCFLHTAEESSGGPAQV